MASKRISPHTYIISAAAAVTLLVGIILTNKPILTPSDFRDSEKIQAAEVNSLSNSSFENGAANWTLNANGALGTFSQDSSTKVDGNVSAKIDITQAGSNSGLQFYQTAPITNGKQYIIRFSAKASSSRSIDFKMDKGGSSVNHFEASANLSTSWQQFSYQFTAIEDDSSPRYEFNIGGTTGQVWLDNATFNTIVNTPSPIPTNSPSPTPTRSPSPAPTRSPSPTPSLTPVSTPSPTPVRTPSPTPIRTPSPTPIRTPSPTPVRTPSPVPQTAAPAVTNPPIGGSTATPATTAPTAPTAQQTNNNNTNTSQNNDSSNADEEAVIVQRDLLVSNNNIVVNLNRNFTTGAKVYGNGFIITSNGPTLWNIKYSSQPSGTGFEPSSGIIRPGQTSTLRSYISATKPNGTYRGEATIEYYYNGGWKTGPNVRYAIGITGTQQASIPPQSESIFTPSSINNSPMLEINSPSINQQVLAGQTLPLKWTIKDTATPINTALLLQKATGAIVSTINSDLNSVLGNNSFSWKIPPILPGDYKLNITTDKDISSTSSIFTIGSRIIIHAGGTPLNDIYPSMQLSINNRIVKTYYGVHRDTPNDQYAQYYYYASTKITPKNVKIIFPNDEYQDQQHDRNLVVDKINIDGIDYQTEDSKSRTEWLLTNGFFSY
ncbi:MAG: carbohydrate binding domain-containing protein [bacterium]|nr:carbohydrate binding domain-containing protein [bacterium]